MSLSGSNMKTMLAGGGGLPEDIEKGGKTL